MRPNGPVDAVHYIYSRSLDSVLSYNHVPRFPIRFPASDCRYLSISEQIEGQRKSTRIRGLVQRPYIEWLPPSQMKNAWTTWNGQKKPFWRYLQPR